MQNLKSLRITSVILLLLIFFSTSCIDDNNEANLISEIESFNFYTESFAPFNFISNQNLVGVSVDILDQILKLANVDTEKINIEISDWHTAYQNVLDKPNTMLFSMVKTTEREDLFKWVGPISLHQEVIISKTSSSISISDFNELQSYSIGIIEDYSTYSILIDGGISEANIISYSDINALYQALEDDNVDCIAFSETGHNLHVFTNSLIPEDFNINFEVDISQLFFAFNINTSDEIINLLQQSLNLLKQFKTDDGSSEYDKILYKYNVVFHGNDNISDEQILTLVDQTCEDIEDDYEQCIFRINRSQAPYLDPDFSSLYTFVYDTTLTIVAHAANDYLVGQNFNNMGDVSGKLFRNEILNGAIENGNGWVNYIYSKPDYSGIYYKTTYYKICMADNGNRYIVCAGKYN